MDQSDLPGDEQDGRVDAVLSYLRQFKNRPKFPSIRKIAAALKIARMTVWRIINELRQGDKIPWYAPPPAGRPAKRRKSRRK